MKKLALIAAVVATIGTASATEVGIRLSRNGGAATEAVGVTVGQNFGAFGAEATYDRSTDGSLNVNRYSLVGTRDVAKIAGVTLTAKAGAAYLDTSRGTNGYAGVAGVGASYALTKNVSVVADYAYQRGGDNVRAYNGNIVSAGLKYSF